MQFGINFLFPRKKRICNQNACSRSKKVWFMVTVPCVIWMFVIKHIYVPATFCCSHFSTYFFNKIRPSLNNKKSLNYRKLHVGTWKYSRVIWDVQRRFGWVEKQHPLKFQICEITIPPTPSTQKRHIGALRLWFPSCYRCINKHRNKYTEDTGCEWLAKWGSCY